MGFWTLVRRLLKIPESGIGPESEARIEAVVASIQKCARPCVRVSASEGTRSWLGGAPLLASGEAWPRARDRPYSFLASLDLAEVAVAGGPDWLPLSGRLQFYVDEEGYGDPRACLVTLTRSAEVGISGDAPQDVAKKRRYARVDVGFELTTSLPLGERGWKLAENLNDDEWEEVAHILNEAEPERDPDHRIGGYPNTIQDDAMEAECELEHQRRLGGAGEIDPEAAAGIWHLLLQFDSDRRVGFSYADGGRLYFWVRDTDARAGDFTRVLVTSQTA